MIIPRNSKLQHSPSLPIVSNAQVYHNPVHRDIHCQGSVMEMYLDNTAEEALVAISNISSPDKSGSSILQYGGCSCSKMNSKHV